MENTEINYLLVCQRKRRKITSIIFKQKRKRRKPDFYQGTAYSAGIII